MHTHIHSYAYTCMNSCIKTLIHKYKCTHTLSYIHMYISTTYIIQWSTDTYIHGLHAFIHTACIYRFIHPHIHAYISICTLGCGVLAHHQQLHPTCNKLVTCNQHCQAKWHYVVLHCNIYIAVRYRTMRTWTDGLTWAKISFSVSFCFLYPFSFCNTIHVSVDQCYFYGWLFNQEKLWWINFILSC